MQHYLHKIPVPATRQKADKAWRMFKHIHMSQHIYLFNGDLRLLAGAISNTLTGSLIVLYTVHRCKEFLKRVETATEDIQEFRIFLEKIYVWLHATS